MFGKRDVIIFLAGAAAFHAFSHIFLWMVLPLPIDFKFMVLTPGMNFFAILCNVVITVLLLVWASRLGKGS